MKNIGVFLSGNFQFLEVKFSYVLIRSLDKPLLESNKILAKVVGFWSMSMYEKYFLHIEIRKSEMKCGFYLFC